VAPTHAVIEAAPWRGPARHAAAPLTERPAGSRRPLRHGDLISSATFASWSSCTRGRCCPRAARSLGRGCSSSRARTSPRRAPASAGAGATVVRENEAAVQLVACTDQGLHDEIVPWRPRHRRPSPSPPRTRRRSGRACHRTRDPGGTHRAGKPVPRLALPPITTPLGANAPRWSSSGATPASASGSSSPATVPGRKRSGVPGAPAGVGRASVLKSDVTAGSSPPPGPYSSFSRGRAGPRRVRAAGPRPQPGDAHGLVGPLPQRSVAVLSTATRLRIRRVPGAARVEASRPTGRACWSPASRRFS